MREYPYPSKSDVRWISPDWLDENMDDVRIIDVQPNVHDYIMGHIPGAVYMNEGILRVARGRQPASFVPPESIESVFSSMGISRDVPVVVYSGPGVYSRCAAGVGYGLAHILDGGIEGWMESGRKLTKEFPDVLESRFRAEIRCEHFVGMYELRSMMEGEDIILFDARPTPSYEGQAMWIKPGHIPGAHSLPWRNLMTEKNSRLLRSDVELRSMISGFDLDNKKIIVYCGTGREATNEYLFFKYYLGHPDVRIYEGSFTEWSSYQENPTVTGPNPR